MKNQTASEVLIRKHEGTRRLHAIQNLFVRLNATPLDERLKNLAAALVEKDEKEGS